MRAPPRADRCQSMLYCVPLSVAKHMARLRSGNADGGLFLVLVNNIAVRVRSDCRRRYDYY